MSAPSVIVFPSPQRNIKFLQAVVGVSEYLNAHVCGFTSDPDDKACPDANSRWAGGRWSDIGPGLSPDMNTYFSISTYTGNTRGKEFFRACHAVVLDDVGTPKASAADVLMVLGDPSWKIETSPGNEQWGYALLPPETNAAKVEAILDALIDRGLTDAGGQNVTRYARLPVGSNTKRALGSVPWVHVAKPGPSPLRKFGADELLRRLAVPDRDWSMVVRDRRRWISPEEAANGGLIIRTLESWGDLTGTRTRDGGWHMTACPWDHEHTAPGDNRAAVWPGGGFKCNHHHCFRRNRDDLLAWFYAKLENESGGLISHLAQLEFDAVRMTAAEKVAATIQRGVFWNPWRRPVPPSWPGDVLPSQFEDLLHDYTRRNGLSLSAQAASYLTAVSGAADKRALVQPYAGSGWSVRPNLWTAVIAPSGYRKSELLRLALERLERANGQKLREYLRERKAWDALPASLRNTPEPALTALLVTDATVEKLQDLMAESPRGLLYAQDELAAMFDFKRYQAGSGDAVRGFWLSTYDGRPYPVLRMKRTLYVEHTAMALLGFIQPERLAEFKGLEKDGLLQRLGPIMDAGAGDGQEGTAPIDMTLLHSAIDQMLALTPFDLYRMDIAGEASVRDTERTMLALSRSGDMGEGLTGFALKLHGVQAKVALVLHLLDGGIAGVIPEATVRRARRYVEFLMGHARIFYAGLPGAAEIAARGVASYVLRQSGDRFTAGALTTNVRLCRGLALKEIQAVMGQLVTGHWLRPEREHPENRVWLVQPGVRAAFVNQKIIEEKRVEETRNSWKGWTT